MSWDSRSQVCYQLISYCPRYDQLRSINSIKGLVPNFFFLCFLFCSDDLHFMSRYSHSGTSNRSKYLKIPDGSMRNLPHFSLVHSDQAPNEPEDQQCPPSSAPEAGDPAAKLPSPSHGTGAGNPSPKAKPEATSSCRRTSTSPLVWALVAVHHKEHHCRHRPSQQLMLSGDGRLLFFFNHHPLHLSGDSADLQV